MTIVAVILVDRKGRKFLLMVGSGGIVVCLAAAGFLFLAPSRAGSIARTFSRPRSRTTRWP